jgi:hypothetical protein
MLSFSPLKKIVGREKLLERLSALGLIAPAASRYRQTPAFVLLGYDVVSGQLRWGHGYSLRVSDSHRYAAIGAPVPTVVGPPIA